MALIYCPECKKQISDKAGACPHCGLPRAYFVSRQNRTDSIEQEADKLGDYKTLRNMLIAFDGDYAKLFNRAKYIS